jgi:hypothetical protein
MLLRALLAAALGLCAAPGAAAAGTAVVRSVAADVADISGVGCGVAATAAVTLPATASAVAVRHPRAGDTTQLHHPRLQADLHDPPRRAVLRRPAALRLDAGDPRLTRGHPRG